VSAVRGCGSYRRGSWVREGVVVFGAGLAGLVERG